MAGAAPFVAIFALIALGVAFGAAITYLLMRDGADSLERRRRASAESLEVFVAKTGRVYHTNTKCTALTGLTPKGYGLCTFCAKTGVVRQGNKSWTNFD